MVKKKVDPRVRGLIEHGVTNNQRSLFVLVGDHGKDQVENIHRLLSKTRVKSRPSVLWCYKKDLGFSTHKQKRMKEIKKQQARGLYDADRDDPFDLFISSTNIRWTYYKETENILGQTFGMCVLQDFEAITPNVLARTIETVEGGGIVIILLKTVKSLKQLYTMTMDVHSRFRTEAHHEVVPRFNERFILSLSDCTSCLVLDDELNILPISSHVQYIPKHESDMLGKSEEGRDISEDPALTDLKRSVSAIPHVGQLVNLTRTEDQAKAVMTFLDAIGDKGLRTTVSLTAGRGRGKSAAIGLCLAAAVAYGYSNLFITAPSPENLKTAFEFVILGLKALKFVEHIDYEVLQEHVQDVGKVVVRINVYKQHRQTIQYILPTDHVKLAQAELVAIDEAAAIPLPVVKKLLGPYTVFMSSTINGYEGTGRALSLKLINQLRQQQSASLMASAQSAGEEVHGAKSQKGERKVHEERWKAAANTANAGAAAGVGLSGGSRKLVEIELQVPIRYSAGDPVESWLNKLLCLDITTTNYRLGGRLPPPSECELYIVDRDALFSYHPLGESLLQRVWGLYTSAHYKNSPNDLQVLSDAPAHRLFVLLGPRGSSGSGGLPDILVIVQVAFEGKISAKSLQADLDRGHKASGDLIPWVVSTQYNEPSFAGLSGGRIVRIATHSDAQGMGYGGRAVELLYKYFGGEMGGDWIPPSKGFGGEGVGPAVPRDSNVERDEESGGLLNEKVAAKTKLPALLTPILDRPAERLHYLGVSFGLTPSLLNFWSKRGFAVVYVRQSVQDLTGEHSCIVLKELDTHNLGSDSVRPQWLGGFVSDYRNRLVKLLGYALRSLPLSLALALIDPDKTITSPQADAGGDGGGEGAGADMAVRRYPGAHHPVPLTLPQLLHHFSYHDLHRLQLYARGLVDYHLILDLLPTLTHLLFTHHLPPLHLSPLQAAVMVGAGAMFKEVGEIAAEVGVPTSQVMAFLNKSIKKISTYMWGVVEREEGAKVQRSAGTGRIEQGTAGSMVSLAEEEKGDEVKWGAKEAQRGLIMKEGAALALPAGIVSLPKESKKRAGDDAPEGKGSVEEADGREGGKKKKHKKQKDHK